jgi:hypothetical protein
MINFPEEDLKQFTVDSVREAASKVPLPEGYVINEFFSEVYVSLKAWLRFSLSHNFPMPTEEIGKDHNMIPLLVESLNVSSKNIEQIVKGSLLKAEAQSWLTYLITDLQSRLHND